MKKFLRFGAAILVALIMIACASSNPGNMPSLPETPAPSFDGQCYYYLDSDKARPFNIIITGDGFTAAEYDSGFFDEKVDSLMAAFFRIEPYKTYKEYFRVWKLVAHSNRSGLTKEKGDTRFRSVVGGAGFMPENVDDVYDFVMANVPGIDTTTIDNSYVILLGNTDTYGGGCTNDYVNGKALTCLPLLQPGAEKVNIHESGHGIAKLGDEYANLPTMEGVVMAMPQVIIDLFEENRRNDPWKFYPNLHPYDDPEGALWAKYYDMPGYENVGFYEGGNNWKQGCWRSTERSIMNKGIEHAGYGFNVICREAIVRRLLAVAGEPFDFRTFLSKDSNEPPVFF